LGQYSVPPHPNPLPGGEGRVRGVNPRIFTMKTHKTMLKNQSVFSYSWVARIFWIRPCRFSYYDFRLYLLQGLRNRKEGI